MAKVVASGSEEAKIEEFKFVCNGGGNGHQLLVSSLDEMKRTIETRGQYDAGVEVVWTYCPICRCDVEVPNNFAALHVKTLFDQGRGNYRD